MVCIIGTKGKMRAATNVHRVLHTDPDTFANGSPRNGGRVLFNVPLRADQVDLVAPAAAADGVKFVIWDRERETMITSTAGIGGKGQPWDLKKAIQEMDRA